MNVLELGSYIVPAYCGMLLAEQGHAVEKWSNGRDPVLSLRHGDQLWAWINHGKLVLDRPFDDIESRLAFGDVDLVVDNIRPATLTKLGIDPAALAARYRLRWVSMRADNPEELGETSFDILAQARSTMRFMPWMPFYLGDTAGGLFLAFKALASTDTGHFTIEHAGCLAKLVEGELIVDVPRDRHSVPWDADPYYGDEQGAHVQYKGRWIHEPIRDRQWQLDNLRHKGGRIIL